MLRIFRAFVWMRWRVFINSLERTAARDTLERFSRRYREARTDHRARPAHPFEPSVCSSRHHGRFRPRRAVVAGPGGARPVFPAVRDRADHLRTHRPALARRRERRPISAAPHSTPVAVHRADGGGFRRSVDPAHDDRYSWGCRSARPSAASDYRGLHARGRAGAAAAGRWPDVAHLDRHSPAAAQSAPRRPRHALRRARPAADRAATGDAWQRPSVPCARSPAGASGAQRLAVSGPACRARRVSSEPVGAAPQCRRRVGRESPRGIAAAGRPRGGGIRGPARGIRRLHAHARHAGIPRHPARQRTRRAVGTTDSGSVGERVSRRVHTDPARDADAARTIDPGGAAPDLHRVLGDDLSQRRHRRFLACRSTAGSVWRRSAASCACSLFFLSR